MSLTDKIKLLSQELIQRQKAQQARALLQNFRSTALETNSQIQAIADSGNFNTLDADVKAALLAAWGISKAAETALLKNVTIAELLDWKP